MSPLTLEDPPRLVFERNPLRVVVAQARFPAIFALEQTSGVAPFQQAIRDEYPLTEPRGTELTVQVSPVSVVPTGHPAPWRFKSDDENWIVALATDFVSLETIRYERFELFRDRLERVLTAVTTSLGVRRQDRFGLRYVNEISHPEAKSVSDWQRFLDAEVFGLSGAELLKDRVGQSMHQIQAAADELSIVIRHGYVSQEESSIYLMDIDVFDPSPQSFEVKEMLDEAWRFKQWVWRIFRGSITDELVDYLNPQTLRD